MSSVGGELAVAYVRIRPQTAGFRPEVEKATDKLPEASVKVRANTAGFAQEARRVQANIPPASVRVTADVSAARASVLALTRRLPTAAVTVTADTTRFRAAARRVASLVPAVTAQIRPVATGFRQTVARAIRSLPQATVRVGANTAGLEAAARRATRIAAASVEVRADTRRFRADVASATRLRTSTVAVRADTRRLRSDVAGAVHTLPAARLPVNAVTTGLSASIRRATASAAVRVPVTADTSRLAAGVASAARSLPNAQVRVTVRGSVDALSKQIASLPRAAVVRVSADMRQFQSATSRATRALRAVTVGVRADVAGFRSGVAQAVRSIPPARVPVQAVTGGFAASIRGIASSVRVRVVPDTAGLAAKVAAAEREIPPATVRLRVAGSLDALRREIRSLPQALVRVAADTSRFVASARSISRLPPVSVQVHADTSKFDARVGGVLPPVSVKVTPDTAGFRATALAALHGLPDAVVALAANTTSFRAQVARATAVPDISVRVQPLLDRFTSQVRRAVGRLPSASITVGAATEQFQQGVRRAVGQVPTASIALVPNVTAFAEEVRAATTLAPAHIRVDADTTSYVAATRALPVPRPVVVPIRPNASGFATAVTSAVGTIPAARVRVTPNLAGFSALAASGVATLPPASMLVKPEVGSFKTQALSQIEPMPPVEVPVRPALGGFRSAVERAEHFADAIVHVRPNVASFTTAVRREEQRLKGLAVPVTAAVGNFAEKVSAAARRIPAVRLPVVPDAARFASEARRETANLPPQSVRVSANTAGFRSEVEGATRNLPPASVLVEPNTARFATEVERRLANLPPATVNIVPNTSGLAASTNRQVSAGLQNAARTSSAAIGGIVATQQGKVAGSLSGIAKQAGGIAAGIAGFALAKGTFDTLIAGSAQFERSLNTMQVVSSATATQMKAVSDRARALGADLSLPAVSASDAAQAMTELAKGGLSVQQSISAAKGTLQLAAAAEVDNATAATIAARALNSFKLGGDQAGRVADVLANAANASTGEITDMALALQQSSAVAHQAGLSIEDTATAISLMANAGIVGSDAGTSLKTMLQRLVPVTSRAKKEVKELGIEFQDAHGNLLPLPQILENYKNGLSSLTPVQRQSALQQIFGTDAIRAANILIDEGAAGFNRMHTSLSRQGSAAAIAAAKMKGLAGAWEGFTSNVQTAAIAAGTHALPVLTQGVRGLSSAVSHAASSKELIDTLHGIGQAAKVIIAPLTIAARVVSATAGAVGGRSLLAGAATFFAIRKGIALTAAAQGFYTRAVQASAVASGQNAAATTAMSGAVSKEVAVRTADTVAVSANTAAMETNTVAATVNSRALLAMQSSLATTSAVALAADARLAAAGTEAAAAAGGFQAFARGAGSLGLAAVGGEVGIVTIGLAALAGAIIYAATKTTEWEKTNDSATSSLKNLGDAIKDSIELRRQLGDATRTLETDRLGISAAQLRVAQTRAELAKSTAPAGSLENRSLILNVKLALNDLKNAEAAAAQAARDRNSIIAKQNRNMVEQERQTAISATSLVNLRDQYANVNEITKGDALRGFTIQLQKQADQLQKTNPRIALVAKALIALTNTTGRIPTRKEIRIVLRTIGRPPKIPDKHTLSVVIKPVRQGSPIQRAFEALGFSKEQAKAAAGAVGQATGVQFGQSMKAGVLGQKASMFSAVDSLIEGATREARNARNKARGEDLSAQEAALTAERARAQQQAAAAQAAAEKELKAAKKSLEAARKLRDTQKEAATAAREQLASAREALLSRREELDSAREAIATAQQQLADTIKAGQQSVHDAVLQAKQNLNTIGQSLAQAINDFLDKTDQQTKPASPLGKRFKELRDELLKGAGGPQAALAAQQIFSQINAAQDKASKTSDTTKRAEKVTREIADLTNKFNKGAISVTQFVAALNAILRQFKASPKSVGVVEGSAAADAFKALIQGLIDQAKAIKAGPKIKEGGLEPAIVKPLEAVAAANKANAAAQKQLVDATKAEAKASRAVTRAQLTVEKDSNKQLKAIKKAAESQAKVTRINARIDKAKGDAAAAKAAKAAATGRPTVKK